MRAWTSSPFLLLMPASLAAAAANVPIAGRWMPEPSSEYVGSNALTISDRMISFGADEEKITGWRQDGDIIDVTTATGREYIFRQDSASRICLEVGVRPASRAGVVGKSAIRCFVKKAED